MRERWGLPLPPPFSNLNSALHATQICYNINELRQGNVKDFLLPNSSPISISYRALPVEKTPFPLKFASSKKRGEVEGKKFDAKPILKFHEAHTFSFLNLTK